jgi:hypothetical protein
MHAWHAAGVSEEEDADKSGAVVKIDTPVKDDECLT